MFDGLTFGIEIETIGITRIKAAEAVRSVVGGVVTGDHKVRVTMDDGRFWMVVPDASLSCDGYYQSEVVSPILQYGDLDMVQRVVRSLRAAGARVDKTCGIHIHVGASAFDGKAIARLAKMVYKQEALVLHALGVQSRRLANYAKPINPEFIRRLETEKPATKEEMNSLWYGYQNNSPTHYDGTRYHGVNLHNVWYRGTVEFRWFEGTLHAGKVKAYIQLVLAIARKAIISRSATAKNRRPFDAASAKYDFRVWLLNLGMIGDEFATARQHLLDRMPGDAAFKQARRVS